MTVLQRLSIFMMFAAGILIPALPTLASRKATDLMAAALKQRAAGDIREAISSFEYALENTTNSTQRTLASFMLGDCQIEAGLYADAVKTFDKLLASVSNSEEQAEALYRLIQAESALGNRRRAENLFARLRRNHRKSPYYELGQAFMKAEGLRMQADELPIVADAKSSVPDNKTQTKAPQPIVEKPAEKPVEKHGGLSEALAKADELLANSKKVTRETVVAGPAKETPQQEPTRPSPKERVVAETAALPATDKQNQRAKQLEPGMVRLDVETTRLLQSALTVDTVEDSSKEALATRILALQDSLKDGFDRPGMDKILLELAENTVRFGELLEACKTYDQLLINHPASPLVEQAYYEAIRLRAILGVHEAVIGWAKAFLAAFPTSDYRARIRALVEYSQAGGRVDLGGVNSASSPKPVVKAKTGAASSNETANKALANDSEYVAAAHKMKEGRYNLALIDFKRISARHPQAPQIWWDLSLVYVQLEDFPDAEKAIKKMLRLDPDNQDANSLLGYIHYRLENYDEAASAYEQAGEPEGSGVNFYDAKSASQRMKKTAGKRQAD